MTDRQRNILLNAVKLGGVFVTSGTLERANVMCTHWGTIGRMWNRDVFILPVRRKKLTNELIQKNMSFVLNVPLTDMTKLIQKCDTLSGDGIDKVSELGLTLSPSKLIKAPGIAECGMHFECKVIYTVEMGAGKLDPIIARDMYIGREFHTIFIGEILRSSIAKPVAKKK